MDALIQLCQKLSDDDGLLAEVTQAIEAPEVYVKAHAVRLARRGVQGNPPGLPWVAVVDGLAERALAAAVSWDADSEAIKGTIGMLVDNRELDELDWEWLDDDPDDRFGTADTETLLYACAERLAEVGHLLVELVYDGDDYNLTVVPDGNAGELVELSHAAPVGSIRVIGR